jgi:hypothetical protein
MFYCCKERSVRIWMLVVTSFIIVSADNYQHTGFEGIKALKKGLKISKIEFVIRNLLY